MVAVAAQAPSSPAFRIRVVLPAQRLAATGIAVTTEPLLADDEARRFAGGSVPERARIVLGARRRLRRALPHHGDATTALVQRQADLLPTLALERRVIAGRRLVLDIDDAIWHDAGAGAGGHRFAALKRSGHKTRWLADRADVVVAGNQLLAEHLAAPSRDVRVIPSLVDVAAVPVRAHAEDEVTRIGWIGSATTAPYLQALRPALQRLAPGRYELVVVGGRIDPVPGVRTTLIAWSEAAERTTLARMDIGLMPLPDTPFSRGKCAYKALQYMAAGIPIVADDVGVSAQVIGAGGAGLIARSAEDWVEAIDTLAADVALRSRLGAEGRRRVAADFSYDRWLPELAAVLRGA